MGRAIADARIKNGTYILSDKHKKKLSEIALLKEVQNKKAKTNLERYGIKNPGVLGAYNSKAAKEYIINFLVNNNISEDRCFLAVEELMEKNFFK